MALAVPARSLLGAGARRNPKAFAAWVLILEAACIGTFLSIDLILFFLFFELTPRAGVLPDRRLGLLPPRPTRR